MQHNDDHWVTIEGLSKSQAEELLDLLERRGITHRNLSWIDQKGFVVSYHSSDDDAAMDAVKARDSLARAIFHFRQRTASEVDSD